LAGNALRPVEVSWWAGHREAIFAVLNVSWHRVLPTHPDWPRHPVRPAKQKRKSSPPETPAVPWNY